MAAQNIALLYWTASTIMWGKIVADTDAQIAAVQAFYQNDPNTSVLLAAANNPRDDASCRAAIAQATGKPVPDDTCAVLDLTNTVVSLIKADAAMNAAPQGQTLVNCPHGTAVGATYNPLTKLFTNPVFVGKAATAKVA